MTRHIGVIDIGKTNAKLALVDARAFVEVEVRTTPNRLLDGPPYRHVDLDGLWSFILAGLADLHAAHGIDAISVTTHGAAAVLLDRAGAPAAPMPDYEDAGPDALATAYDAVRPPFEETGSPRLPQGLNLGAQIHWQLETLSGLRDRLATVVTYPQYWSGRLTGIFRCEPTSLGAHTDLWEPRQARFSTLVDRLGLAGRMAPLAAAGDLLGPVLPDVAARTGLRPGTPVICGIHDSNASLYPHLLGRSRPFAIVSTGTWIICMAVGGAQVALDPARDTLINVAATGAPVPSARFMGGREFECVVGPDAPRWTEAHAARAIARGAMLLPSVMRGSGPFPDRRAAWTVDPAGLDAAERAAVVSLYLGMMTATCLDLTGARGPVIVEGPLARNETFLGMLAAAGGRPVTAAVGSATGTAVGAALLAVGPGARLPEPRDVAVAGPQGWADYARAWRARVEAASGGEGAACWPVTVWSGD